MTTKKSKMTANQVAEIFGVTRRTVYSWLKAGCPAEKVPSKGLIDEWDFDLNAVYKWLDDYRRNK